MKRLTCASRLLRRAGGPARTRPGTRLCSRFGIGRGHGVPFLLAVKVGPARRREGPSSVPGSGSCRNPIVAPSSVPVSRGIQVPQLDNWGQAMMTVWRGCSVADAKARYARSRLVEAIVRCAAGRMPRPVVRKVAAQGHPTQLAAARHPTGGSAPALTAPLSCFLRASALSRAYVESRDLPHREARRGRARDLNMDRRSGGARHGPELLAATAAVSRLGRCSRIQGRGTRGHRQARGRCRG